MKSVGDRLGDYRGIAAGAFIDDEIYLDLVLHGFIHDFGRILNHLRIHHAGDQFVEREGLGIGFLVAHPQGSNKPNDCLFPRVKNSDPTLPNCFLNGGSQVQWEKPKPTPCFFRSSKAGS